MILHVFSTCKAFSTILTSEKDNLSLNLTITYLWKLANRNRNSQKLAKIRRNSWNSLKMCHKFTGKVSLHYEIGSDYPNVLFFQKFSGKRYNLAIFIQLNSSHSNRSLSNSIYIPNGLSVECLFMWRSRLASFAKTLKQTLHMNIFTPSWIFPCDVKSTEVVKACPQTWQMNGFRSLW